MGLRGPPSEASLTVVAPPEFQERPRPLAGMTKRGGAVWIDIVAGFPPTWFRPADMQLLRAYCEACALNAKACAELGKAATVKTAMGGRKPSPWNGIRNATAGEMASLATKLRLTVSARTSDRSTEANSRPAPTSKRSGLLYGR